jgi:HEAT repeat protein
VNSLRERATSLLMLDVMFASLRIENEPLNSIAIELFGRFGEEPVRRLVLEAADRKNKPGYRLRALRALARIGAVTDASSFMNLYLLLNDRNEKIRAAAADLIFSRRIGTPTPKEARTPPA